VIELDSARAEEVESRRYELYREIWYKEFQDIRDNNAAPICLRSEKAHKLVGAAPVARP